MNTKYLSLTILLALSLQLQAQSTGKRFSKSFNTEGKSKIVFALPGKVDLKVWGESTIRIEINAALPGGNPSMLNELANVGRYNLTAVADEDKLLVQAPNLQRQIKVRGQELREEISFQIFVPAGLEVETVVPSSLVAGR